MRFEFRVSSFEFQVSGFEFLLDGPAKVAGVRAILDFISTCLRIWILGFKVGGSNKDSTGIPLDCFFLYKTMTRDGTNPGRATAVKRLQEDVERLQKLILTHRGDV